MSTSTLAHIWSLDTSPHSNAAAYIVHLSSPNPTPSSFKIWLLSTILYNRWSIHLLPTLLSVVPPSQARLRDEGLALYYEVGRGLTSTFKSVAQQRGVTLPPFPDIPADWRDGLAIDTETLYAALEPHAAGPVKEMMDPKGRYYWESLVASISVGSDVYLDTVAVTSTSPGTPGDATLAPYKGAMGNEELARCARVLREEVTKARSQAGETGWREDEAREVVTKHMDLSKGFWSLGME